MPRNSDGEFEMVLGNKQLLSLFFLVVVLFAVFFSLGYMVGKSVGPSPTRAAASPDSTPAAPDATPAAPPAEPPRETTPATPVAAAPPPAPEPVTETKPARVEPEKTEAAAPPTRRAAPPKAEPPPAAEPPAPKVSGASAVSQAGLFLQVAATKVRSDADALAGVLRKKGYDVKVNAQAPDGWLRILVGPLSDERSAQDMKAQLEKDGFKSIVKKKAPSP